MKKVRVRNLRGDKWKIEEDLVLKKENVYMLKEKKLRLEIIQLHYFIFFSNLLRLSCNTWDFCI